MENLNTLRLKFSKDLNKLRFEFRIWKSLPERNFVVDVHLFAGGSVALEVVLEAPLGEVVHFSLVGGV